MHLEETAAKVFRRIRRRASRRPVEACGGASQHRPADRPRPMPAHFTAEERERQAALNRSWDAAQRDMADPVRRAQLEAIIAEMDAAGPRELTRGQQDRQDAMNASWEAVQRHMVDPEIRARLEAAVADVDAAPPSPLNRAELLALATADVDPT